MQKVHCQLKGGMRTYSYTSSVYSWARDIIVLINLLKLGGPGDMLPKEI